MLQRFESRAVPLAVRDDIDRLTAGDAVPRPTAGSMMRLAGGDIAADLRPVATHGDGVGKRSTTYELLVSNDTPAPLATFAYAPDTGTRGRLTWNVIVVPPFSAIAVRFDVAVGRRSLAPRVMAELFAEEGQLTLDAPAPQAGRTLSRRAPAIGAAALLVALALTAFAQVRPHIVALAAPVTVGNGAPFTVAYALGAGHRAHYVVQTPEGHEIDGGDLDGRTGAFTVTLPTGTTSRGYDVRLTTMGRLGFDERTAHVIALPAKRVSPRRVAQAPGQPLASVGDLALERDTVHGGEAIVATYRASNPTGIVRLIDALGTVRAEALLTPRGRSILIAPMVAADQDFRVVATVDRGTTHAEAAVPVTILHGAPALPTAADLASNPSVPGGDAAASGGAGVLAPRGSASIAVDPVQHATRPIVVRIDRYYPGLHVALMGDSTDELAGTDVAPGDTSVVLRPPDRVDGVRYAIVATYASGVGEETLVRRITFRAP